ncbi:MAG: hypothetical protein H5T41_10790 [Methanomassiliicoccales archaeon]|nr:hypothetical protein [Methanomassiliicoccales archaeon]
MQLVVLSSHRSEEAGGNLTPPVLHFIESRAFGLLRGLTGLRVGRVLKLILWELLGGKGCGGE